MLYGSFVEVLVGIWEDLVDVFDSKELLSGKGRKKQGELKKNQEGLIHFSDAYPCFQIH